MQLEYEDAMKADLWILPQLTTLNIEYHSYKRLKVHESCWSLPALTTLWSFLRAKKNLTECYYNSVFDPW